MTDFHIKYLEKALDKIADFETKIAESEADKKALICDYESRIIKEQELMSWLEHENEQLKQQLAEKEKELARLKLLVDSFDKLKQYDKDADLILINPKTCYTDGKELVVKADNQDKISFCIKQLRLLKSQIERRRVYKDKFGEFVNGIKNALYDVEDDIDNLIKQLKDGK